MPTHRVVVCLGVLTAFLAVACCVLLGLVVWREVFKETTSEGENLIDTTNMTEIRQRFPGYFRTRQEQARLQKVSSQYQALPVFNVSAVHRRCFNNSYCKRQSFISANSSQPSTGRRRRQINTSEPCDLDGLPVSQLTFHACCISYSDGLPITPDYLPTAEPGQTGDVQVAQFHSFKQYFETEKCCQAKDCHGCQCSQTFYVTSAVVWVSHTNGGMTLEVQLVRVPGCCQCLNITQTNTP